MTNLFSKKENLQTEFYLNDVTLRTYIHQVAPLADSVQVLAFTVLINTLHWFIIGRV